MINLIATLIALIPTDARGFATGGSKPGGDYWNGLVEQVMIACDVTCVVCGVRKATEVGHIVPAGNKRQGYYPGNLAGMCRACNKTIADRFPRWQNFANPAGILTEIVPYKIKVERDDEQDVTAELIAAGIL